MKIISTLLMSILFVTFSTGAAISATAGAKNLVRTADAVKIAGADLPALLNAEIPLLRLYAFRAGRLTPIPFQVDQKDTQEEWVWDVALREGQTHDDQDPPGESLLDENDLLVFLSKDTGDKAPFLKMDLPADKILEIKVNDPVDHGDGWVYFALFDAAPPPLSPVRYMTYDPEKDNVHAPRYLLSYSKKHIAVMDALNFYGKSILDRLKIRIKAEIKLGFIKTSMHFNEEDVGGYHVGYINGPVRIVNRTIDQVHFPLGLKSPKVVCDHYFYPSYAEIPLLLHMNFLVSRASLLLSADYRDAPFRQAFLPGLKNPADLTTENPLRLAPMKGGWIALDGDQGTVINAIEVPKNISRYITTTTHLILDRKNSSPPEAVPGSDPEAGIEIQTAPDLPKGDYLLYTFFFFSPDHYQAGNEGELLNILNRKLTVQIRKVQ